MSPITDLAAFLAACYDEDERIARAATDVRAEGQPECWRWECTHDDTPLDPDLAIASNEEFLEHNDCCARVGLRSTINYPSEFAGSYGHLVMNCEEIRAEDARHLARYDPARELRQVETGRKMLADLLAEPHFLDEGNWYGCQGVRHSYYDENGTFFPESDGRDVPTGRDCTCGRDESVERRLRILASVFSDHPGYPEPQEDAG